jgi:hypothetical protein
MLFGTRPLTPIVTGSRDEDPVDSVLSDRVHLLSVRESRTDSHVLGGDVLRSDPGNEGAVREAPGRPVGDRGGRLAGESVSPDSWIEPVEQVQDVAPVELHDLDPAEPDWRSRVTAADNPVPEAEAQPVFIPSSEEPVSFIEGGKQVGRIVCARSPIAVHREDRIDVAWHWPP